MLPLELFHYAIHLVGFSPGDNFPSDPKEEIQPAWLGSLAAIEDVTGVRI